MNGWSTVLSGILLKFLIVSCIPVFALCFSTAATADDLTRVGNPEAAGFSTVRLARIASWYQAHVDPERVPGAVVAITRNGKHAYLQAVGFQDREKKVAMRPDSIFLIGSMSKPVTAVATMILVDEGKLDLDAPVSRYLPELEAMRVVSIKADTATGETKLAMEPQRRPMTIRDLLSNTSGLIYPEWEFGDLGIESVTIHSVYKARAVFERDKTLADFVASVGKLPLAHQPGEVWEYGWGFDVLPRVVEVVSGQNFDEFLQSHIFQPLHMIDTGFYVPATKLDRLVDPMTRERPPTWDVTKQPRLFSGGGGLVSTASDYVHFCQMLLNAGELDGERILRPETVRLMTANALPPDIRFVGNEVGPALGTSWGLGFAVRVDAKFSQVPGSVGSFGWQSNWGTHFWVDPSEKLIAVVMTQAEGQAFPYYDAVRHLTYRALRVPELPVVTSPATSDVPGADMVADYAGRYTFGRSTSSRDQQGWAAGDVGQIGIGYVALESGGLRIVNTVGDGPIAKAGIVAGDLITDIDGGSIKDMALEQIFKEILGPAGTEIRMRITRAGRESPVVVTVTREPVLSRSVELEVRAESGKLVIASVGQWPILEFEKARPVPVVTVSRDEFRVDSDDKTRINFVRDSTGEVSGMVLNPGPWEQLGVRLSHPFR